MSGLTRIFSVILLAGSILLSSCSQQDSKLKSEVITPSNLGEIASKIKDDKNMSNEDVDLFTQGLLRLGTVRDSITNKTVGQVIDMQKAYMRTLSNSSMTSAANRIQMSLSLGVTFTNKLKFDEDTVKADGTELSLVNNSGKTISSVKGQIRIINSQKQLVKVRVVDWNDVNLEAGKSTVRREFWNHDPKNQFDQVFRDDKNLTAIWIPESIVFADGKKLSLAE